MQPRSVCIGAAILICALLAVAFIRSPRHQVALLEQIAPRIERAQTLTPESRQVIMQLMERVRDAGGDARDQTRRDNAIQRVTDALNARDRASSIGQGTARQ